MKTQCMFYVLFECVDNSELILFKKKERATSVSLCWCSAHLVSLKVSYVILQVLD